MLPASGQSTSVEGEVRNERLRVAFQQIPVAVIVTVVNAALIAAVLMGAEDHRRVYAWLAVTVAHCGGSARSLARVSPR